MRLNLSCSGGPAGAVYGFLFVWIGVASTFAVLSELASMYRAISLSEERLETNIYIKGPDVRWAVSLVLDVGPAVSDEAFQLHNW